MTTLGDYPPGTTQAMHDAAFDADDNAIMAVIEDRADDEIAGRDAEGLFVTWLLDRDDAPALAELVAIAMRGDPDQSLGGVQDQLRKDYLDFRVEAAKDQGEWDEIARELARGDE